MLRYKNRETKSIEVELIYGEKILNFLYADNPFSLLLSHLVAKVSFISKFYGWLQKRSSSKKKIIPFIQKYKINSSEFLEKVDQFSSFNDFFIRKLKKESRPIAAGENRAIIPADGRYLFYPNIQEQDGIVVKGKKLSLEKLLESEELAKEYEQASLVIARLCPSDYHRFHFPCACIPKQARLINGPLYSVNPISIKKNISILCENKRMITELETAHFGKVLYIEIGATNVGTIHQTYIPNRHYNKGDEKGYFSFGGSSLILIFPHNTLNFDSDLLSNDHTEILCLMGQSLGISQKR